MSAAAGTAPLTCPKCRFVQPAAEACARCGIVIARFRAREERGDEPPGSFVRDEDLVQQHVFTRLLTASRRLIVEQQARHLWEVFLNWEQRNEYDISGDGAGLLGSMAEQGTGVLAVVGRMLLGSHRSLEVAVFAGPEHRIVLELVRPFYWINSWLDVRAATGESLGEVQSRLSLLYRFYELRDDTGRVFATIESPRWRPWTFPILDAAGTQRAVITKKWRGLLTEYYTDADSFGLDFGTHDWTLSQRAVIFAAMVSVDYDYFENNPGRGND